MNIRLALATTATTFALVGAAQADILTVSAAAKLETTGSAGYLGDAFDGGLGYGLQADLELIGIDVQAEALMFGNGQFAISPRLGFDMDFGEDIRITPGVFAGMTMYYLKKPSTPGGLDVSALPADVKSQFPAGMLDTIQTEYASKAKAFETADRTLWALNAKARLTVEYKLIPLLYLGIEGDAGPHYLLSGSAATTKAKKTVLDAQQAKNPNVPTNAFQQLGDAIGANKSTSIDHGGIDWSAGAFIKLEI